MKSRQLIGVWTSAAISLEPTEAGTVSLCKADVVLPDGATFHFIATRSAKRSQNQYMFQGVNNADSIWAQSTAENRLDLRFPTGRGGSVQIDVGASDDEGEASPNQTYKPTPTTVTSRAGHEPRQP